MFYCLFFQITPIESPTPKRFSNVSTRRGRKVQFEPVAEEVFENNEVAMDITTHETVQDNHGMFIEFRNTTKNPLHSCGNIFHVNLIRELQKNTRNLSSTF